MCSRVQETETIRSPPLGRVYVVSYFAGPSSSLAASRTRRQLGHDEGSKALGDCSCESVGEVTSVSRDCARDA